jgi:hypothetical protein
MVAAAVQLLVLPLSVRPACLPALPRANTFFLNLHS